MARKDERILKLMEKASHKTLALWAIDCAERVLPYFEEKYPDDPRPRNAIKTLQEWIKTGVFKMAVIRAASLASHAAARATPKASAGKAREKGQDSPARSAARAAGQAVATAHVRTHALGPALYARQAIHRASAPAAADTAVAKERDWQYQRLLKLIKDCKD